MPGPVTQQGTCGNATPLGEQKKCSTAALLTKTSAAKELILLNIVFRSASMADTAELSPLTKGCISIKGQFTTLCPARSSPDIQTRDS